MSTNNRNYLLHPLVDFFMIGGLSLLLLSAYFLLAPNTKDTHKLGWIMFYLSFVVNFPHFLISYQFLYIDNRDRIMKDWRSFIAAVIAPGVLIAYAIWAVSWSSSVYLGYMVNAMFFLVGWHYIKQIFGCVIISSALQKFYFNKKEKVTLLINGIGIWFISYLNGNQTVVEHMYVSIAYKTFALPAIALKIAYLVTASSFVYLAWQMLQKFIREGKWIPFNSVIAFSTLYIWHIPALFHPGFFLMIPFFHSLQYLLFAFSYTKNRFASLSQSSDQIEYRTRLLRGTSLYILASVITGGLFFHFIPKLLDTSITYDTKVFGPQLFMFSFHIFLNIHHYFIDAAIWRRDNENVRKYLLK